LVVAALLAAGALLVPAPCQAGFIGDVPVIPFGPVGLTPDDVLRFGVSAVVIDPNATPVRVTLGFVDANGTVVARQTFTLRPRKTFTLELDAAELPPELFDQRNRAELTVVMLVVIAEPLAEPVVVSPSLQVFDALTGKTTLALHPGGVILPAGPEEEEAP